MMKTIKIIFLLLFISQTALSSIDSPGVDEGVFSGPTITESIETNEYSLRSFTNTTFKHEQLKALVAQLMKGVGAVFEKNFMSSEKPSIESAIRGIIDNFLYNQQTPLANLQKDLFSIEGNKNKIHHIVLGISYADAPDLSFQQDYTGGTSDTLNKILPKTDFESLQKNITKGINSAIELSSKRELPKFIGFFLNISISESDIIATNQLVFALPKLEIPLKQPIIKDLPTSTSDSKTKLKLTNLNLDSTKSLVVVEIINNSRQSSRIPILIKFGPFKEMKNGLAQLGKQKVKYLPYFRAEEPVKMGAFKIFVDIEIRQLGFLFYPGEINSFLKNRILEIVPENSIFDINKTTKEDVKFIEEDAKLLEVSRADVGVSAGFPFLGIRRLFNLSYSYEKNSTSRNDGKSNPAEEIANNIDNQINDLKKSTEAQIIIKSVFFNILEKAFHLISKEELKTTERE